METQLFVNETMLLSFRFGAQSNEHKLAKGQHDVYRIEKRPRGKSTTTITTTTEGAAAAEGGRRVRGEAKTQQ